MRISRISLSLLLIAQTACSTALVNEPSYKRIPTGSLEVSCIGPESADTFAIYLHGMDSVVPSQHELGNRAILKDIAKALNIRFALPRAGMECPTQPGSICWGWKFDQTELAAVLPQIVESRSACFANEKPFAILGFSNGGYLLTRWYSGGLIPSVSPRPFLLIASGSGKGQVLPGIDDLSMNPSLTIVIGKEDQFNFDPSESLFHSLKALKAPVRLIEFQGGHVLDKDSLLKALQMSGQQTPR